MSSSEIALSVRGLSKAYQIQGASRRPTTLGEALMRRLRHPFRRQPRETFWALDDVSFDVHRGEVVGIVGRNGAGKSTLLKVISRITEPTTGEVHLYGRAGSLLEVGTGFHHELTGRENIYLNGSLLGMSRREIGRHFDAIVEFAAVEQFLDTPVKHYSSGMYVRLAFAVAAHLDPDILIVDEVLAVGDAAFQQKCLGKMAEVAGQGRTVLFVSHHMATMTRLCGRGILLERGTVALDAPMAEVAARYLQSDLGTTAERRWGPEAAPGDDTARLEGVRVLCDGRVTDTVDIRRPVTVEMDYRVLKGGAPLVSAFSFFNDQGVHLFISSDLSGPEWKRPRPAGLYRARCVVPGNLFAEGMVRVVAEVSTGQPFYLIHILEYDSVAFQVVDGGEPGSVRNGWGRPIPGVLRPLLEWETAPLLKESCS